MLSGHSVEVARSGEEGLERIRTVPNYDLVLCDLAMPGMNGWEVARVALNADPKLHFYIMTGWGRHLKSGRSGRYWRSDRPVRREIAEAMRVTSASKQSH